MMNKIWLFLLAIGSSAVAGSDLSLVDITDPSKSALIKSEGSPGEPVSPHTPEESEEDTPVVLESMESKPDEFGERPWQPPSYANEPSVFPIPDELRPQVNFWIEIFSKYSTDQGVLHDSRYINNVYEVVDFTKIENYQNLNPVQKQKAREKLVKDLKKSIKERLQKLQSVQSPDGLDGEDLRYWKMFEAVDEPNKFVEAGNKGRLRFQLGQSDRFRQGIYYSGRYLRKMEEIFKEAGMPVELTRLPFVESSFNIKARSKVGASGIWQFMRSTGRIYMKVNHMVDERNDPITATYAAAKLLKFNYNLLQTWPLAVTAYNFGPGGLKKQTEKLKTDSLVEIIRRTENRRFGFASGNFYASFLAALEVERNANKYLGQVKWSQELQYDEVVLKKPIRYSSLVQFFGGDQERTEIYNFHFSPGIRKNRMHIPAGFRIKIPRGQAEAFLASIEKQPAVAAFESERGTKRKVSASGDTTYRVASGDTLSSIAREFGVSIESLKEVNNIDNPRSIRAGDKLTIPGP